MTLVSLNGLPFCRSSHWYFPACDSCAILPVEGLMMIPCQEFVKAFQSRKVYFIRIDATGNPAIHTCMTRMHTTSV